MLDPKLIRSDPNAVAEQLKKRGYDLDVSVIELLEKNRKDCQIRTEQFQSERNSKSKMIGKAKASGEDIQPLLDEVAGLGESLDLSRLNLMTYRKKWIQFYGHCQIFLMKVFL